jgi:energy-coupling factor transporter ATP-binding protein EcfA2
MDKGAHFHRCDFQVHTPRDIRWSGAKCITPEERQEYAARLVAACREQKLGAIAVTDHHDMLFAAYVQRAAAEETDAEGNPLGEHERLVVFPGMELTLGVPCQALLIFDASFPEDLFSLALTALAITPSAATEARTAETKRLENVSSLPQLRNKLNEHAYLRGRYIVFPNVTNEGKSSLLRTGLHGKYAEMPCVGGYVDGDIEKLQPGIQNIVAGKDKAWGNKRIAVYQTSDNRREDHSDLGRYSTWVKWAIPTTEALRQACLAQESRISHEEPRVPSVVIGAMSLSNSAFLGPVELELNAQYNALIGGRGTGKSTILEYLRWVLCDQPPGIADEDVPNYQARRTRLIEQTLKPLAATVDVRFQLNGVPHLVRRSSADGSLQMKIADAELRRCSEEEVRSLLPIQAFSQKQLSDVSVRVEELERFITAPIRQRLGDIDRHLADEAARVRESYSARVRQRSLMQTLSRRQLEEKSLKEQAAALRGTLSGLSQADKLALDRGKAFEEASLLVDGWRSDVASLKAEALRLADSAKQRASSEAPLSAPDEDVFNAARGEYLQLFVEAERTLRTLSDQASTIDRPFDDMPANSVWKQWQERRAAARAEYDAAVARSATHSDKLKQLKNIEDQLAAHSRETAGVAEELRSVEGAEPLYEANRKNWVAKLKERDDLLDEQCERLTSSSGGAIRARVRRFSDASAFAAALRQAVSGMRIQGGKVEAIAEVITSAPDPLARWSAMLLDLEQIAEFDAAREGTDTPPATLALAAAGVTATEVARMAIGLKTEQWLSISLTPIKSVPVFEYRAREGEYIPFRNASAGQQATALLRTLLSEEGPPLIIDQPEEDLDNPVMLEIVEQIWRAKQKRQLIFASHNANLVVNGDAELVVWCDYRAAGDQSRGTIAGEGAIDIPQVRDAIKRIMEGGEAAFNLRREKYGF